ncbi:MAG: inositol monophosphatase [Rhodothermia bacterium]
MTTVESIRPAILALHARIRDAVVAACERQTTDQLSKVAAEDESDTIYVIDRVSEFTLVEEVRIWAAENVPVILIAEGLENRGLVFPEGASEEDAAFRIIVDPIDGTRGLMYQKRSAWVLTGVAPNKGPGTGLQDIELSVMTEIPLVKQHLSDQGWAIRGEGAHWTRYNRLLGKSSTIDHRPSTADSIAHGFSTVTRLFPNARDVLGAIDDELVRRVLGPQPTGKTLCFEDQYASTGGQMYELAAGHDRFIADVRPLIHKIQRERGEAPCICAHPYDMCALLVAEEGGVIITGGDGSPLNAPLDTTTDVAWIGYANEDLRTRLEPVFQEVLREYGLIR